VRDFDDVPGGDYGKVTHGGFEARGGGGVSGRGEGREKDVHSLRIADFEEVNALRLDFDQFPFGVPSTDKTNRVSFVEAELIHDLLILFHQSLKKKGGRGRGERRTH
jgi:hypothetical protein